MAVEPRETERYEEPTESLAELTQAFQELHDQYRANYGHPGFTEAQAEELEGDMQGVLNEINDLPGTVEISFTMPTRVKPVDRDFPEFIKTALEEFPSESVTTTTQRRRQVHSVTLDLNQFHLSVTHMLYPASSEEEAEKPDMFYYGPGQGEYDPTKLYLSAKAYEDADQAMQGLDILIPLEWVSSFTSSEPPSEE